MCGRFSQALKDSLGRRYALNEMNAHQQLPMRYNVAPSTSVLTVRENEGGRIAEPMFWGMSRKDGGMVINLRVESLMQGSFRKLLLTRRCLVPADGFYEWRREGKIKIPVRFMLKTKDIFSFPAIFDDSDPRIKKFTIFTTNPNAVVEPVHNRMPVIVDETSETPWLDPKIQDADRLLALLLPYPAERMTAWDVSTDLNSPRNDSAKLITPVAPRQERFL